MTETMRPLALIGRGLRLVLTPVVLLLRLLPRFRGPVAAALATRKAQALAASGRLEDARLVRRKAFEDLPREHLAALYRLEGEDLLHHLGNPKGALDAFAKAARLVDFSPGLQAVADEARIHAGGARAALAAEQLDTARKHLDRLAAHLDSEAGHARDDREARMTEMAELGRRLERDAASETTV